MFQARSAIAVTAMLLSTAFVTAATAEPITRNNMAAYCRGEVAGMCAINPRYVATGQIEDEDGGLAINGTVDKGDEGIKKFKCRFKAVGTFIDVMAMTSDGAL